MDTVYHVSGAGDFSGIHSPDALRRRFPDAYTFMENMDVDYMQFGDSDRNIIVKRESADKFNSEQIIL